MLYRMYRSVPGIRQRMAGRALAPLRKIVPLRKTIRTGKGSAIAPLRKAMGTVKATAIVLLVALYTLALGGPRAIAPLWAQTTNPLIAPVPPPAAPSQLPAPVTTAIAPILAPVPTLALATPTPSLRVFNCSCSGRGVGTNWMGRVTAGGYFAARQGAVGACLTYNRTREPLPPTQSARSATTTVPILPGASVPGAAAQLTSTLPGTLKPSTATDLQNCSNCVCD